ncbi:hypothetical protein [Hymenobacter sp.]|jgi:hypothetical protein|uniref:hypothetical protein n=1 Tax=Hymenobacter sp. TaxID=1898978 RepID=UPI002EDBAFE0
MKKGSGVRGPEFAVVRSGRSAAAKTGLVLRVKERVIEEGKKGGEVAHEENRRKKSASRGREALEFSVEKATRRLLDYAEA